MGNEEGRDSDIGGGAPDEAAAEEGGFLAVLPELLLWGDGGSCLQQQRGADTGVSRRRGEHHLSRLPLLHLLLRPPALCRPDFFRGRVYFARTGWLAMTLIPMPAAFNLLALSGSIPAVYVATALIGLSSGFIFAAAVSVTSELFGINSFGVNHNILISNIPLGSFLYGSLAALLYDSNGTDMDGVVNLQRSQMLHLDVRRVGVHVPLWLAL